MTVKEMYRGAYYEVKYQVENLERLEKIFGKVNFNYDVFEVLQVSRYTYRKLLELVDNDMKDIEIFYRWNRIDEKEFLKRCEVIERLKTSIKMLKVK